jgi:homocysteine S-methyltransferase
MAQRSDAPPRREPKLIDTLRERPVVFDGAMGTALYERGVLYTNNFDHQTLAKPDVVRSIHEGYLEAGAEVLCTNTFGANTHRLASHNLEGEVEAINRAAVRLAREVAGDRAWVAGSVGPSGTIFKTVPDSDKEGLRAAFKEQAAVLAEEGVDLVSLETFRQPEELLLALEGTRAGTRGAVPILASVSFDAFGTMADGTGPEDVARMLLDWGADAVGVNCADGPAGVYEMVTRMLDVGLPVVAQPNAGLPRRVEGRFAYMATPEYFLVYARRLYKAGVRGVGGCCGTTADHVRQIAQAARMLRGDERTESTPPEVTGQATRDFEQLPDDDVAPGIEVTPLADKGALGAKLAAKKFVISVEVNPPPGLSLEKALAGAKKLRDGGVDAINVADGARATARMGNLALCYRIQEQLGMPSLMHVTTRDRNVLGLVAHLLASHELGVRNLIVITGDPPKMGDFPDATAVYDLDSIGLLRLVNGLNRGFDPGGKPLKGGATSFLCVTGAEPAASDYERELRRLEQKRDAGAELVMTQPVYDPAVLDRFLTDVRPLGLPVLVGLLPLASYRNAEFLHNEVPGMSIPEDIRERMRAAGGGPDGRAEGVAIAREMLDAVKDRVDGAYIMPPFGRYELALRVIEGIVR